MQFEDDPTPDQLSHHFELLLLRRGYLNVEQFLENEVEEKRLTPAQARSLAGHLGRNHNEEEPENYIEKDILVVRIPWYRRWFGCFCRGEYDAIEESAKADRKEYESQLKKMRNHQ